MGVSMRISKVWFVLSIAFISFGYGFLSHAWGLFPKEYIETAWQQFYRRTQDQSQLPSFIGTARYERAGVRIQRPGRIQPGVTLVSSSWKGTDGWSPELRLINREGQLLHKWRINRGTLFEGGITQRANLNKAGVHGAHLFPNGDIVINVEYVGMARLSACGDVRWTLTEGNHHSIERAEDGSFWVPGVSETRRATTDRYPNGFPGLQGKEVWVDRILRVSDEGEILDDIDVLNVIYENGLERYIPKVLGGPWPTPESVDPDITHINDVEPLAESMADEYPLFQTGDLLVSLRSLSLVFVFDPETMEVKWHSTEPYIYQHDPDYIGNGWIGVFDNNLDLDDGNMLGGSRIVAVQPHTDSVEIRFPTQHSASFYTRVQGKWQLLENGNMLLSEADAGRVVEVTPNGRIAWEWIHEPMDESKVPKVTQATRHSLTREEVASWPCSLVDSTAASSLRD